VTHRGLSTSVTIVTGHEDPTKGTTDTDWDALARAGGTLVVLMGAGRVTEIAKALIAGGRDAATPVAAVRWGTRPEQRTVRATLETIDQLGVEPPSAIVVGAVAGLDLAWFEQRPLFGRRIVVTRAREQASELRGRLEQLGAEVIELPAIALEPIAFSLPALDRYAWLVFTSANGVHAFFDQGLAGAGLDARALAPARVAAIGPGTADALAARGVRADLETDREALRVVLLRLRKERVQERLADLQALISVSGRDDNDHDKEEIGELERQFQVLHLEREQLEQAINPAAVLAGQRRK